MTLELIFPPMYGFYVGVLDEVKPIHGHTVFGTLGAQLFHFLIVEICASNVAYHGL